MSSTNYRVRSFATTENVVDPKLGLEAQLVRLVNASMLWEDQFYLDGVEHSNLIKSLVAELPATIVSAIAIHARQQLNLRHIPLLLCRELARLGKLDYKVLNECIQRADEMAEFLSIYWLEGKQPISNQVKRGLALAFQKFSEYEIAKWDKNSSKITMRDVMFLAHPKPQNPEQTLLFKRVADQELKTPNTWETKLSSGQDKRETFLELIKENKLGALAYLRNLRNMLNSGIDIYTLEAYSQCVDFRKVLPFRYLAAYRACPEAKQLLEQLMLKSLDHQEKLLGKTTLLIDVSGSMFGMKVSKHSDLDRFDAAAALAVLCSEICEQVEIFTFSNKLVKVGPKSGFDLIEEMRDSQSHSGTQLYEAVEQVYLPGNRLIVFTDEQAFTKPRAKVDCNNYIINVASYKNGINEDSWHTVTGFSEQVIRYIQESEKLDS